MALPLVAASFAAFFDLFLSTLLIRGGHTLLAAPEPTVTSTTSCINSTADVPLDNDDRAHKDLLLQKEKRVEHLTRILSCCLFIPMRCR